MKSRSVRYDKNIFSMFHLNILFNLFEKLNAKMYLAYLPIRFMFDKIQTTPLGGMKSKIKHVTQD
jgi:hypothetical protein